MQADFTAATVALAQRDRDLAAIIARVGPCTLGREPKTTDLLHELTIAIIHQQLSRRAALSIQRRFFALYDGGATLTPKNLLATAEDDLRAAGLSRPKIRYLRDAASKVAAGLPSVTELAALSDGEIVQILTAIAGIGRWSAEMLLIFRLYRPNVWPSSDLGIRQAVSRLLDLDEIGSTQEVEGVGDRWQPYRTVAAWYLWRSLE